MTLSKMQKQPEVYAIIYGEGIYGLCRLPFTGKYKDYEPLVWVASAKKKGKFSFKKMKLHEVFKDSTEELFMFTFLYETAVKVVRTFNKDLKKRGKLGQ